MTTETVTVKHLLDNNVPVKGLRADVRGAEPGVAPMVRTLKSVQRINRSGEQWLYLYWETEHRTPEGYIDCGYSGVLEELLRETFTIRLQEPL